MSLIFATQLTAVATGVLGVFAFTTAILAGLAFRKQSQEVGLLLAQNEGEALERRRAQAARVFTGAPRDPARLVSPYAHNASDFPVYDVHIWYSAGDNEPGTDELGVILPRETVDASRKLSVRDALTDVILTFRDAAGVRWIRMPDGALTEQPHATARESVLAALGRPLPAAPKPAPQQSPDT